MINVGKWLSEERKKGLEAVLAEFQDIITEALGVTELVEFGIDMGNAEPNDQQPYIS